MMAPIWGLAIPLPSYLSLSLLSGLLACGVLVLFFSYQRSKQVAAKTDSKTSKQDKLKKAHKLTAQQLEENMMGWIEAHMTCISGFPVGWTQEYILWSMDRSLQQIFQHLENARSSLIQLGLQEPPDMISSTTSSILVAQETVVPPCDCKKAECSADHSFSSGSSASNSKHSCLSVFSEGKSLQFRSSKLTLTPQKPLSVFKNKGTSLPPFQSSESEKSNLLQNLATLSSLPSQSSLISSVLEPLNLCKQEKTKDARSKRYSTSDNGPNSISKKTQIPAETPIRLPSLVKGELEGHMSWKVCTLQKQIVPQPVKESWAILNYLTEVQGVPKTDKIQTQLSMPTVQNTEQNTNNKSPDLSSSFQLHVNIGVESRLNRTETKISQSFISGKQSQPGDGPQILESKTSFMSVGTQSSRSLGVNIIEEETTILKDPKQMLGLSIEQRIIDLTEKRIQQHKAQVTNVESTPKLPYRATDSLKVTPLALLKVMNSMGMVSESSHPEVMESDQIVKPTEAMEMVNITPKPLNRAIESVAKVTSSPQHHVIESESKVPGTWNQVTDNVKVTPLALLQVMGSMGMINKPHPRVTETVEMIPGTLLHQVLESDKMDTWLDHQAIKPEQMSTRLPYKVTETIKITPGPQHKVTKSVSLTSGSQSQASEQVKMIPGPPINQNKKLLDMISTSHEVNDCKVTPVALLKAMDVMGLTALAQTHAVGARDLTPFSQPQIENLTPSPTQPDSLTCSSSSPTSVAPVGVAESGARIILTQSDPRIHSLNTTPMALWAPKEMITAPQSQVLESHDLTLIPISQVKESKALTPWLQNKGLDSVEESLQPQHQAAESAASVPEPHQVIDSSRLIPQHQILKYSEGSPTLSPKVAENIELTSNTWLHMGKLVQLNDSQHQIIESVGIIPRSPGQGTESVEMKQKSPHQVTESPTLTNTSLLQDANYTEVKPMPQLKVMDDMKLSLELKTVKSKNLALQPKFSSIKFTDITTGLDSQMLKCKQMIPTVDSIDLAPVPKQESAKLEELAITLQLHSGKCEQTTPRSPSQGVKSIQLTLGPQLQTVKSAESASAPQLQNRTSTDLTTSSQIQGMKYDNLSQSPEFQDLNAMELALTPLLKDRKSVAPIPSLQNIRLEKKVPGPLLEDVKIPELGEYSRVIPATQVQEMKHKELISGINFQAVKSEDINSKPFNQATGLEGLRPHSSEKLQMASEPEYQGTKANLTTDPCHLVKESIGQLPLGITPRPLSQTSGSMKMTSVSLQDTVDKTPQLVKAMGETLESQHETKESLDLNPELEIQSVRLEVLTPEPQSQDIIVHLKVEPCSKATKLSEITLQSEYDDNETVRMALPEVDNLVAIPEPPYSEIGSLELALGPGMGYGKSESPQQNWQPKKIISESSPFMVGSKKLFTEPRSHAMDVAQGAQQLGIKSTQLDPEAQSQDEKYVNVIQQSTIGVVESEDLILQSAQQRKLLEELTKGAQFQNLSLQQANIQSYELTLGPQLQSVRFSKFPPESLLKGEKPFDLVSGPTHYDMKSDELISDSSMLESKVSGPRQQSTRIEQLIPEPQCEGMNFVELSPGPCLQDIKFSDLTSGPKLQGVKFGEDTPRSRVYGGNSVEATPELGLHDSKFVKISPNIHMKQVGLNSGPCLQDVKFFDLTPEIQPQGMKSSELNSGPQLQCVKFSDLTSEPEKQGVTSAQLTPRPERQGIKSESLEPELLLRGIKLVMANQMPNSEGKMSCELTSEARKPGIESLVLVPGPQLPKLSYSEFTRRQKLQESKLIQGSKMKVVKLVEQTLVSNLQGLKSKQFPSELQSADKKSVMLNQGHYLGGIKSMQLKPKPKLGNVNSVMLTSATEAGGVKPGELIVDSNLQGLKPKMLTSGLQFGGLKSVPLTAGPNVESTKSKEKTPRPQLEGLKSVEIILGPDIDVKSVETTLDCQHEDVKSMELTPSSKILDFKTMELVPHTQLQDAKAMELKLGPKMPSEDSAAFVPELLQSVKLPVQAMKSKELISESQMQDMKCVENTPSLKLQSSKPIKEIPDPQLQSKKSVKIHPRPRRRIIKSVDVTTRQGFQGANSMGLNLTQPFQWRTPIDLTPGTEQHSQISVNTPERTCVDLEQLNTGSESEGIVPSELIPKPQSKDVKSTDLDNAQQWENAKLLELAEEFECESELQSLKSPKLTLGLQLHQVKPIVLISEPQLTGVKTVELNEEPQTRRMKSIQWIPRPGLQDVKPVRPHIRSQSLDVKCAEFKPFMKMGSVKSSELIDGPKFPDVKPTEMSPGSELQKDKLLLTSEPQLQSTETVELSQFGSMKSIQWIPAPEFQGMKYIGLNLGSQSLDIKSANLKYSTQLESVKSSGLTVQSKLQDLKSIPFPDFIMGTKIQDVTSTDPKPGPLLQDMKSSESMPSIKLQEMKLTNFTSGPQLEDVKSSRLVKGIELQDKKYVGFCSGPRLQTVKSSQPTPGGKVQGVNLVEFKFRPKLQGDLTLKEKFSDVKSVKLNSSLQLQFGNSEQITDMKFQNIKPMDFSSGTYCKGTRAQARGRIPSTHPTNRSSPWDEKLTHKERSHRGSGRERVSRNSSERNWQSLSDKSQHFPSERSQCSPSERTLRSLSERNHRSRCRRNHRSPSERTLQSLSERGHHSPLEGRRGAAAEKRRPREGLHRSRFTEWSPRCPSERSHLSSSERRHRSPSEPSLSSPASERRRNCSCAGRTRPGACERGYHSPRSERSRHSHSERSWYSHSERSQSCPTEKVPHSPPKERLQHSSPKRRPRHGVSKDVRSCSNTPPRNHTKKPQSRESLEA
ncbi:uncharacterized protein C2orf16 homolog [Ochotona princeps]|uniref:uncharacterized protein C2orf16 homolog n=1 Tax=Ochotona princeps TaxID=9978 RepID=UPI002714B9BA|nr:uncharacterized protein C2orf16 homolog [Ochotona princeps]